jgi:O-antigen/teichoic acid export membrane protein
VNVPPTTTRTAESGSAKTPADSASSRAFVGAIWTSASQFAPYVYTTIVSIIAARVLGPDDMGRQSFITFVVVAAATVCTSGLSYSITRFVGELSGQGRERAVRTLVGLSWRLAALASAVGGGLLVLVALLGAEPQAAWLFGAVAVLASGLHKVPASVLIGGQRWRSQSLIVLTTGAVSVVATIATLALGWGITGMLAVTAGVAIAMLAWSTLLMRRFVAGLPAPAEPLGGTKASMIRFAAANSIPVILSFVVLQRSEFFFLDRDSTDDQIALYSIAFSAMLALLAVPSAVRMVVIPSVSRLVGAGQHDRVRRGFSRLVRLSVLVTFPMTAGALALGPALLPLVYGEQYEAAGKAFLILVAPLPLVPLSSAASALLMGYGLIRVPTLVSAFAALVDIGAAAVLVPRYDAVGAAIANVLALLAATFPLLPYSYRLLGGIDVSPREVVRIFAAAAAAGVLARVVLLLGESWAVFVLALLAGTAVFAALAALLRLLPAADADWIAGMARARGGTRAEAAVRRLSP